MYQNKYGLKFGCDPEVFASYQPDKAESCGTNPNLPFAMSPAAMAMEVGFKDIGGPAKHPIYLDSKDWRIIGDGVAYEINLKGPCIHPKEMYDKCGQALFKLENVITQLGFNLHVKPVINFDFVRWWNGVLMDDEKFYWSTVFGCDPDKDAFNVDWLAPITDVAVHPFRYGGGHIHISGDVDLTTFPLVMIKMLALTVGNYVNSISPYNELEIERAKYYGKPGKYRVQTYGDGSTGIEYRTPSNSWLALSYEEFERIFDYVDHALYLLKHRKEGREALAQFVDPTIKAITTADKKLSAELIGALNI
jgi:hypothetical protein